MFEAFKNFFQKPKPTTVDSFQKAEISFEETSSEILSDKVFEPSVIVPEVEQKIEKQHEPVIKVLKRQVNYRKEAAYRFSSQKN